MLQKFERMNKFARIYLKIFLLVYSLIVLVLVFPKASFADPYLIDDLGLWSPVYIKLPVNEKIKLNFEANPRIQENITHINQLLIRPSIGYQLTKNLSVWQGYCWVTNYIPRFIREERIWQQLLHEKEFSKFSLTNRFRLEERLIQDVEGVSLRGRYLLKTLFPITKNKHWSFVLSDELFVNLDAHHDGPQVGIDQNRFFIGVNRKLSENVSIEGGYQMQYVNFLSPYIDRLNHIVLVNLYINLPQLMKNKDATVY